MDAARIGTEAPQGGSADPFAAVVPAGRGRADTSAEDALAWMDRYIEVADLGPQERSLARRFMSLTRSRFDGGLPLPAAAEAAVEAMSAVAYHATAVNGARELLLACARQTFGMPGLPESDQDAYGAARALRTGVPLPAARRSAGSPR